MSAVLAPAAWVELSASTRRLGLKGPRATAWLQQRGIAIPAAANQWCSLRDVDTDVVVRLGWNEYLIEHTVDVTAAELARELAMPVDGVYPVLREDCAIVLGGNEAAAVLAQVCNVNFDALPERSAVMTMMIGVAVTVVPQGNAAQRRYRIWCDPTFGDYVRESLEEVVRELQ